MDIEGKLNPEQFVAVTHGEGPQLVLAGAGSGKTRVITYRIAWLIRQQGVAPSSVAAVTFTNKAAREMNQRVSQLLERSSLSSFVGTFHRFGVSLLRRYGDRVGLVREFSILDSTEQLGLIKQALQIEQLEEHAFPPRAIQARISSLKNRLQPPDAFEAQASGFFESRLASIYRRYQGLTRQASAVDFDDLIVLVVKLLRTEPELAEKIRERVRYLLVDEYQDTNHAQLQLILGLVGPGGNLTAVGDEDQGIYRWRGAEPKNILGFERGFPSARIRKLERNYRSTQTILDAAGALVSHNRERRGKRLWTDAGPGDPIELYRAVDEGDEARWVSEQLQGLRGRYRYSEMAVLVRTNAQTRALEEELLRRDVPYTLIAGVRFYERAEIKDLVAYLRVLRFPRDTLALDRIINQPPRGIGRATRELLNEEARRLGHPLWDVLRLDQLDRLPARAARAVRGFRDLVLALQEDAGELSLTELLGRILERSGYAKLYPPEDPESEGRIENIREFLSAAQEFAEGRDEEPGAMLTAFLDRVALVTDVDGLTGDGGVALMTLHSAKGLEFPVVAVTGLEEGLLPHFNSQESVDDLEEERRLFYVGMTRAGERLLLATCRRRRVAGRYQDRSASPFLSQIPAELLNVSEASDEGRSHRTEGVYSFFGGASSRAPSEPSGAQPELRKGSYVRHATLGRGVVLDMEGEGEEAKLTVFFDRAGKRKLVAKFASLERA